MHLTIKDFTEILKQYPDDARLRFLTYHDSPDASVYVTWERDPDTDKEIKKNNEVWISVD